MSEPFPKTRALPPGVDLRAREAGPAAAPNADPLAELARLVGRDDPFRDLFPARKVEPQPRIERSHDFLLERPAGMNGPDTGETYVRQAAPTSFPASADEEWANEIDRHHRSGRSEPGDGFGAARRDSFRLPALSDEQGELHDLPDGFDTSMVAGEAPPLNADLWAQGMPEPVSTDPETFMPVGEDTDNSSRGSHRRTVVVLAAVLALTAGGLGATFLVHGPAIGASTSGAPPTIMADTGPSKVQPPDTSNQSTGGDGTTALLEKSASDNVNNATVVNTQESPVDLSQLPKPAASAQPDDGRVATGNGANPFPEPHKVKTVLIRPDGSVVDENAGTAAAPPPAANAPFADNPPQGVTDPDAVARPATPKSTARATATPKTAATTPAGVTAPPKPKPAHVAPKPKPKPLETADAGTPAQETTASTSTGAFAVQLAAPSTEKEANDVMGRLQKKFANELDGREASVRKADKGDKSVYRVRVGNLSQEDAKSLCSKLQAGGGSCFVVRN